MKVLSINFSLNGKTSAKSKTYEKQKHPLSSNIEKGMCFGEVVQILEIIWLIEHIDWGFMDWGF